nr:MAG TPA: hypothetical protein [Caudoviricetes sp.]
MSFINYQMSGGKYRVSIDDYQGANVSFYMGVVVKAGYTFLFAFY